MGGNGSAVAQAWKANDLALNRLAGWYAIVLRAGSAALFAIVGPLAAVRGVSAGWLTAVLVVLAIWAAVFVWVVWRGGLSPVIALADAVVIALLVSAHRHVVPAGLIAAGTTWILPLASTSVFILQLALSPVLSLPAAAAMTAVYFLTAGHPASGFILGIQAVVTAGLMSLLRRAGRDAEAAISAERQADHELRAEAARRAEEREAHRRLHDTVLSTLTMVASGTFAGPSQTLSGQATRDRLVLTGRSGTAPAPGAHDGLLGERLRQVVTEAAPLRVGLTLTAVNLPSAVIEPIAGGVAEALMNVSRHARTGEADVIVRSDDGRVIVEIADRGPGFDPAAVPPGRRGLRESIAGRLADAGGSAEVETAPGKGTRVVLRWPA